MNPSAQHSVFGNYPVVWFQAGASGLSAAMIWFALVKSSSRTMTRRGSAPMEPSTALVN